MRMDVLGGTLLAISLFIGRGLADEGLSGVVVGVADGDTLTLLTDDHSQVRIRLAEIDAPEKPQPWGQKAKAALSALVYRGKIQVAVEDVDRYGRTVGRIYGPNGEDVNAALVREGHAWVYRQYMQDRSLLTLEEVARASGRGLWGLQEDQRVPPWEWRQARRSKRPPP